MKTRSTLAALAAALAIAGCGDNGGALEGSSDVQGNGTDRAFVEGMIPHHESAVEMAKVAKQRGESPFVKKLADDIIRTQTQEISTLRNEDEGLETAGVEVGTLGMSEHQMGMEDTEKLRTAKPFDEAFMKMMITHHVGAIDMAEVELAKGADPELKSLAEQIITAQTREIDAMRAELGIEAPAETEEPEGSESEHGSGHSG